MMLRDRGEEREESRRQMVKKNWRIEEHEWEELRINVPFPPRKLIFLVSRAKCIYYRRAPRAFSGWVGGNGMHSLLNLGDFPSPRSLLFIFCESLLPHSGGQQRINSNSHHSASSPIAPLLGYIYSRASKAASWWPEGAFSSTGETAKVGERKRDVERGEGCTRGVVTSMLP